MLYFLLPQTFLMLETWGTDIFKHRWTMTAVDLNKPLMSRWNPPSVPRTLLWAFQLQENETNKLEWTFTKATCWNQQCALHKQRNLLVWSCVSGITRYWVHLGGDVNDAKRETHQVTWFWKYCLQGRKSRFRSDSMDTSIKEAHICEKTTDNRGRESTYWIWDVADGVHPDFPRYRKCVDPVELDSVLVFQQVRTIYCHLWVHINTLVSHIFCSLPPMLIGVLCLGGWPTLKTSPCTKMMVSKGAPRL